MSDRKSYWKNYYNKKVKPDKEKMAIRSQRSYRHQSQIIILRLKRSTWWEILGGLNLEMIKKVMKELMTDKIK